MTDLTERYLAAALRGVPHAQRTDVERELRSSIDDAVEDRVASGEARDAAETAVLEGLGDPARLSAGITGRPLFLIGPDLFIAYRHLLVTLLGIVVPIVGLVQLGLAIANGDAFVEALLAGVGGAWTVGLHIFFWVTITFAAFERFDAMRDARDEITAATGRWTVDNLPAAPQDRVTAGETVGEVVTTVLMIGGLLFLNGIAFTEDAGEVITLFNTDTWSQLLPVLVAILAAQLVLRVVVYLVGRWTLPLAIGYSVLDVAFTAPVIVLALSGSLINPAFADAIGWPPLADGRGVAMVSLAIGAGAVTAWDVITTFRRARRADARAATVPATGEAAR